MRTADRSLALLYFEVKALRPRLAGFTPIARYRWAWFDPRSGRWTDTLDLTSAADGTLDVPPFPGGGATLDWAAKVTAYRRHSPGSPPGLRLGQTPGAAAGTPDK